MRKIAGFMVVFAAMIGANTAVGKNIWKRADIHGAARDTRQNFPSQYITYTADETGLQSQLFSLSTAPAAAQIIELPMPDGSIHDFKVWRSSLIPDLLASKYPGLRTFTGVAVDNQRITAKLDFTAYGFHGMVYDGEKTALIDPYDNSRSGYYMVHYKKDETVHPENTSICMVKNTATGKEEQVMRVARKSTARVSNGYELRTYRLALACDHQYADSVTGIINPTIEQVLSKMTTSMNRINGVLERELSITLAFVDNEDRIIWTADSTVNGIDPFRNIDGDAVACNDANQVTCDSFIKNANYDMGHVFTTGAGGYSKVGVVCQKNDKAKSATGRDHPVGDDFDIDFVIHEMGHELGANHPFNNGRDGECNRNRFQPTAYEPGSGSTIMAYAGICNPDDLQPHSDAYFHLISLLEIQDYITNIGNTCGVKTPTNNKLVELPSFAKAYNIPYLTPFELLAPTAQDSVANTSVTYSWEEMDLGIDDYITGPGTSLVNTHEVGPIFRSFTPSNSPLRVFPKNSLVLSGILSDAGTENNEGEKAPDVARPLTFKLTMRNIYNGYGCFLVPDDSIFIDAINTGAGFTVTSQNTTGSIYNGNSSQVVTWNKVGTNASPINAQDVDIFMSADGGNTWPYHIGQYLNNGSAIVTLPNPDTTITAARIKVKGSNNVFFNVNGKNFTVLHSDAGDTLIRIYPIPAHNTLRVNSGNKGILQGVAYNILGQEFWRGEINGELDIPVYYLARGVYFIKLIDIKNQKTIKKFVVE